MPGRKDRIRAGRSAAGRIPERDCPWRRNRHLFPNVTPEMWEWFEQFIGGDGITMRCLVLAGSGHAKEYVKALTDEKKLLEAGYPVRFSVVAVCLEDYLSAEGCAYVNAHNRFPYDCADIRPDTRTPGILGGDWLTQYVKAFPRWFDKRLRGGDRECFERMVVDYGDPCDLKFRARTGFEQRIRDAHELQDGEPLFHMVVGLPWGRWIGPFVRDACGELVVRDHQGAPVLLHGKRQLVPVMKAQKAYCFCLTLHPTFARGGSVSAELLRGANVMRKLLEAHVAHSWTESKIRGRLAFYGIGPREMDDPELLSHGGPPGKFATWEHTEEPIALEDLSTGELRRLYQEMVDRSRQMIPKCLFTKGRTGVDSAADAITNRIIVQFRARHAA